MINEAVHTITLIRDEKFNNETVKNNSESTLGVAWNGTIIGECIPHIIIRGSLRFEKRRNFSINPRKLSIFYRSCSNRSGTLQIIPHYQGVFEGGLSGGRGNRIWIVRKSWKMFVFKKGYPLSLHIIIILYGARKPKLGKVGKCYF